MRTYSIIKEVDCAPVCFVLGPDFDTFKKAMYEVNATGDADKRLLGMDSGVNLSTSDLVLEASCSRAKCYVNRNST